MPLRFKHTRIGHETTPTIYDYNGNGGLGDGYNNIDIFVSDIEGIKLTNSIILAQFTLLANDGSATTCAGAAIRRAVYKVNDNGSTMTFASGFPKQETDYWSANGEHAPYTNPLLTPTQTAPFQFPEHVVSKDPTPTDLHGAMFPIRQAFFTSYLPGGTDLYIRIMYSVVVNCQISWEVNLDVFNPV
jgi:hypothetical protein